jgi:pimeloyl-ACP methyl ester carboxylesterase
MSKLLAVLALSALVVSPGFATAATPPPAVIADPAPDPAHPAGMAYVRIPSHEILLNGVVYTPSGAGPHPTVLLLHGFPGNEQNLDLAQAIRRAGFNVLTLHYRGSWGSGGDFSFTHAAQDADAAIGFLRAPANLAQFATDPARIFVIGHSMGGLMAEIATAHDPKIAGLVMISAADLGAMPPGTENAGWFRENVIPLAGCTPESLGADIAAHRDQLSFKPLAPSLQPRPVLLITSEDGLAPASKSLADQLRALGNKNVDEAHFDTDHAYSDHRIALESLVVTWLSAH